jgi:K+-sensing histidine kinase KdpD
MREHRTFVVAAAALLPLVTCIVLAAWRETINVATAVLVLALIIVAAAATGDRLAGVVAALSSGAWFDFFLTEPYNQFTIYDADDIEATALLVLIGLAVTEVALWGRREQARASRRAGYLDGVLSTAEAVLSRDESADVRIDRVARQIAQVLGVPQCRFVAGPLHDPRPAILHHDGLVTRADRPLNVERDGLPTDEETALLVGSDHHVHGHFILTASDQVVRPTLEQRKVAVLLADQVAPLLGELLD